MSRWAIPIVAAAALVLPAQAAPAAGPAMAVAKERSGKQPAAQRLRAQRLRAERRRLTRMVRRSPAVVRKRWFLRRASHAGIDLPLTVRLNPVIDTSSAPGIQRGELNSDDSLQLDLGGVPASGGVTSGVESTTLTGSFRVVARFGKDVVGAGGIGSTELGAGPVQVTGSGVPLLDFDSASACPGTTLLESGPLSIVEAPPLGSGDRRGGYLNWFTNTFEFRLYTQWNLSSMRRGAFAGSVFTDDCAGAFFWTPRIASTGNTVIPVDLQGQARVSPAITTDGRLRLMVLYVDDAVLAQQPMAAKIHTCSAPDPSATPASAPAPSATCDGSAEDLALDAQVETVRLTAEVLIGG